MYTAGTAGENGTAHEGDDAAVETVRDYVILSVGVYTPDSGEGCNESKRKLDDSELAKKNSGNVKRSCEVM
jgi:hypothetical protein